MSLRSWRSWMPARKSCASRIIGLRDGAGDGGLDLHLDARQGALHDLDEDRVDRACPRRRQPVAVLVCRGQAGRVHRPRVVPGPLRERRGHRAHLGDRRGCRTRRRARRSRGGPAPSSRTPRRSAGPGEGVAGPQVGAPVDVGRRRSPASASKQTSRRASGASTDVARRRCAGGDLAQLGAGDRADAGDPQVDPLDLLARVVAEVVAVELAVLVVERARPPRPPTPRRPGPSRPAPAPRRPGRSSAGRRCARSSCCSRGKPSVSSAAVARAVSASKTCLDGGVVERGVPGDVGLHVVVLDVDGEQPERRHVARVLRHDDAGEVEDVDQPAGQQRPRAAEGRQHEVAHVEAALDRHLPQGVGLVPRGDLEDPCGAALTRPGPAERPGDRMPSPRRLDVERDLAAEQVRGDPAEHQVGVGDGRLGAALAVAERAGVGAGRLRPHLERALGRDPGDRAAAGPDRDDVDHRDLARVGADRALGGERRLAVEHDGDVGRGAAAVAGEHLGRSRPAGRSAPRPGPPRPGRTARW